MTDTVGGGFPHGSADADPGGDGLLRPTGRPEARLEWGDRGPVRGSRRNPGGAPRPTPGQGRSAGVAGMRLAVMSKIDHRRHRGQAMYREVPNRTAEIEAPGTKS